jgi:thiaminase/transcriptional activator TenA
MQATSPRKSFVLERAKQGTQQCSDVFDWLEEAAKGNERFDLVFCSYGAICWLSNLSIWAKSVILYDLQSEIQSRMTLTCKQLLQNHSQAWQEATVHPFLEQCKLGTIKPEQFNTWLVQDYQFVVDFTRIVARVLAVAPLNHFDVILGGLSVLKDELNWFKEKAAERQLNLATEKQPTCIKYCEFMDSLAAMPYPVQAAALWAIELAYNQGWQLPGVMPSPYNEFADRWGNSGFTEYVKLLEQQADEVLKTAPKTIQQQTEQAFLNVAQLEKDFWQMAFNASF